MTVSTMSETSYLSYLEDMTKQFIDENALADLDLDQLQSMSDEELYEWISAMGIELE